MTEKQLTGIANGTLIDRGNGLIYDSIRNITWLNDANYAQTSGYAYDLDYFKNNYWNRMGDSGSGKMTWCEAVAWIDYLNRSRHGGFTDWRLPKILDDREYVYGYDGTTSGGYNITTSEMGHMYYVLLEKLGRIAKDGTDPQPGFNRSGSQYDILPFINIQNDEYWSESYTHFDESAEKIPYPAWSFEFGTGHQGIHGKRGKLFAWAVRDGDILAPPSSV